MQQASKLGYIRVWQWNCRGYRNKRHALQTLVQAAENPPTVIALQEVGATAKLPGYKAYHGNNNSATAVLVHRNVPAERVQFDSIEIPHDLVVLYPQQRGEAKLYILNIYSTPRSVGHKFGALFSLAKQEAGPHALLITGDFNAPHTAWGYRHCTRKGRHLWEHIQAQRLVIESDPNIPTRVGNSAQCDSSPDLTLTYRVKGSAWSNIGHTLGSDHFVLQTDVNIGTPIRSRTRQTRLPNWDKFREKRSGREQPEISPAGLERWAQQMLADVRNTSTALDPDIPSEIVDPRLQHLWDAFRSIQRRWRKHKHNRKLRLKLAHLETEILSYSAQVTRNKWYEICDNMKGTLGMKRTWSLLRHLLDPTGSKTEQRSRLTAILQKFPGSNQQLLDRLCSLYVSTGETTPLESYRGSPNASLDAPITESEVRTALVLLRPGSAPGSDGVTNKMLRNLDDSSITALTAYFNHFWEQGNLPPTWKHAKITLIPKPGKPLTIEHLRPISLTSCVGKVMEHVILTRLTNHINRTEALPHSVIGFRPKLSTQDILLQLFHDIISQPPKLDSAAILAIDLTKAFDRVSHVSILRGLESINPGERIYNYVRNFLSSRTAVIQIGELQSDIIQLSSVGTPQGAVLSPLLFNLALLEIPRKLAAVPYLRYSLYADDITLWVPGGSDALIEETLQHGAQIVETEARLAGLSCSPEKSQLLILPAKSSSPTSPNIKISVDHRTVPEVSTLRVLGLTIQRNRGNGQFLSRLSSQVNQTIGLIRRIASRHHGLKERERIRLVQAFIISRITYSLPYLKVTNADLLKINCLIRKAYKAALQIPLSASTARLDSLGVYNTAQELLEAHRINQLRRLSSTPTGRHILDRLKLALPVTVEQEIPLPQEIRDCLRIRPLPRNMHPVYHAGRREQRARILAEKYPINSTTMYVDAAEYRHKASFALAVISHPNSPPANSLTLNTSYPAVAEEAAIALALSTRPHPQIIITDSKTAIQNYARGTISAAALKILTQNPPLTPVDIVWTPAHTGLGGNEAAHTVARGLTIRAGVASAPYHGARSTRDRLLTFQEVTEHYRLSRRQYPPAHSGLSNAQERVWRLLQTNSLASRALLNRIRPSQYPSPNCPLCGAHATLVHSMWACPLDPFPLISNEEQWEGALGSSELGVQTLLVTRAATVAASLQPAATSHP